MPQECALRRKITLSAPWFLLTGCISTSLPQRRRSGGAQQGSSSARGTNAFISCMRTILTFCHLLVHQINPPPPPHSSSHIDIPRSSIIPFAFCSNGVIHPAALAFIDLFLCKASRIPINEPPSVEKMKVLHAISKAIVDQTATLISNHFSKFIHSLYNRSFPIAAALSSTPAPRRGLAWHASHSSAEPLTSTSLGGVTGPSLPASRMHSLALPAASAAPAPAASPRRSLRSNFGVPYGLPSDSCDSVNGLAVGLRGRR